VTAKETVVSQRAESPAPTPAPVGRPRSGDRQRPGGTPREEILDAAAELFTRRGYAATSTRMIAEAVGIRQASLYYHVSSKEELLEELLTETVRPSLAFAASQGSAPADAQLFALAAFDTAVLCGGRWNLGTLYLLPEVRGERFADFRADRAELRACYTRLIERAADPELPRDGLADLVFGLVESVITLRSEGGISPVEAVAERVAAGCLRLIGVPASRIGQLSAALGNPVPAGP
jgi:AcrR family transcriptional regulator